MKFVIANLILVYSLLSAVSPTQEVKFADLSGCIENTLAVEQKYRGLIPPTLFFLDRNLMRTAQRIPLMVENFAVLKSHEARNPYTVYMVDNAIASCETLRQDFEARAKALFLFVASFGVTLVVFVLSFSIRSVFLVPSREASTAESDQQDPPQDRPQRKSQ